MLRRFFLRAVLPVPQTKVTLEQVSFQVNLNEIIGYGVDLSTLIISGSGKSIPLPKPLQPGTERVHVNGLRLSPIEDYSIQGNAVVLVPAYNNVLGRAVIDYRYS